VTEPITAARPSDPVSVADRPTAATSPLAAFAGLTVGLLVVKMTRPPVGCPQPPMLAPPSAATAVTRTGRAVPAG
jgi:hypothetical protein